MPTSYDMDAQTFISHTRRRPFLKLVMNSLETSHEKKRQTERENDLTLHQSFIMLADLEPDLIPRPK
jgi:hypothetical protein